MLSQSLLRTFLAYNAHANAEILRTFAALSPAQAQATEKMSHGTALELIRHMADTEWSWRLFASGGAGQAYLWEVEDISDLEKLTQVWMAEAQRVPAYVDTLSEDAVAETIDVGTAQGGAPRYVQRWQIFLHLVNHSTHHRSELSHYLEACGQPVAERDLGFLNFVVRTERAEC